MTKKNQELIIITLAIKKIFLILTHSDKISEIDY